jgi:hypothetical protein
MQIFALQKFGGGGFVGWGILFVFGESLERFACSENPA